MLLRIDGASSFAILLRVYSSTSLITAAPRSPTVCWLQRAGCLLAIGVALLGPAVVEATPEGAEPPANAVSRFLGDQGLIDPAAIKNSALVQQVRDRASALVMSAMHFIGVPYRRGGTSEEDGFDCSGFTRHVFDRSLGLVLPRRADEQARAPGLLSVKRDELKPGDLVFFNTLKRTFSHVGIYVGEGKFIHAPRTGSEVRVEDMRASYWAKRFTGARRADIDEPALMSTTTPAAAVNTGLGDLPPDASRSTLGLRAQRPE